MNVKMTCRPVTRRVVQGLVGMRCSHHHHHHQSAFIPHLKASPRESLFRPHPKTRRWASSEATGGKQGNVDLPLTHLEVNFRLSSLDPTRFTLADVLDLSGVGACMVKSCGNKTVVQYKTFGSAVKSESFRVPFPPGTKGVFYFNDRTDVHPVAGDIRFRILPLDRVEAQDSKLVDTTKLFADGKDLLDHTGLAPWRISLLSIIYKQRAALFELLKERGNISETAEAEVERLRLSLAAKGGRAHGLKSQIVDRITDPFSLNLSAQHEPVIFLQQESITPQKFGPRVMTNFKYKSGQELAYSGTVLVRFEVIPHEKRAQLVLRVLKFLRPPNPNDVAFQREGQLLMRYNPSEERAEPWMGLPRIKFITKSSWKLLVETYLSKAAV